MKNKVYTDLYISEIGWCEWRVDPSGEEGTLSEHLEWIAEYSGSANHRAFTFVNSQPGEKIAVRLSAVMAVRQRYHTIEDADASG